MIHWDSELPCISCESDGISALNTYATAEDLNQAGHTLQMQTDDREVQIQTQESSQITRTIP